MPETRSPLVAFGAINAAIAVAAGAFAAHGLRDRLEARMLEVFETGARYHLYHAVAMVLAGMLAARGPGWTFQIGLPRRTTSYSSIDFNGFAIRGRASAFCSRTLRATVAS